MSRNQLIRTIRKEIRDLNWVIDMKIVKGMSYRREARRHKLLLMQLNHLSKKSPFGFMTKLSNVMATLVF